MPSRSLGTLFCDLPVTIIEELLDIGSTPVAVCSCRESINRVIGGNGGRLSDVSGQYFDIFSHRNSPSHFIVSSVTSK